MKKLFTILAIGAAFHFQGTAQVVSSEVAIQFVHDGLTIPELDGFVTYRVYINMEHEDDFVSLVYGNTEGGGAIPDPTVPFGITLHEGTALFQSSFGGCLPSNCSLGNYFEIENYDSYFTIGVDCINPLDNSQISPLGTEILCADFENESTATTDEGGIYTVQDFTNGWAGPDKKILLAQITADGPWSFCFSIQGQIHGYPGFSNTYGLVSECVSSTDAYLPAELCGYDSDFNGIITIADLTSLLGIGGCSDACYGDLNGDNILDFFELLSFMNVNGEICE